MPVVATLTAIALLRGDGASTGPFFDPQKLRELLNDGLEGAGETELEQSLAIAEKIQAELDRYSASVEKALDAYIDAFESPHAELTDLVGQLAPLDAERARVLDSIIAYRGQLKNVLEQDSWDKVFN